MPGLALFDLDHTLLDGDSDVLWCAFLLEHRMLEPSFRERSARMERDYVAGTVTPADFCSFFASTLAGRSRFDLRPWRERFVAEIVRPRIPDAARALLQRHRDAGDTLVLTTATNRVVTELTAAELGVGHLIATEVEEVGDRYTGRTEGLVNMRTGKVERLHGWLDAHGLPRDALKRATFYSDSINDLPLLGIVGRPVAVDPDDRLRSAALRKGWPIISLHRRAAT